eukprot:1128631-Prymnesium_polylepis.1
MQAKAEEGCGMAWQMQATAEEGCGVAWRVRRGVARADTVRRALQPLLPAREDVRGVIDDTVRRRRRRSERERHLHARANRLHLPRPIGEGAPLGRVWPPTAVGASAIFAPGHGHIAATRPMSAPGRIVVISGNQLIVAISGNHPTNERPRLAQVPAGLWR